MFRGFDSTRARRSRNRPLRFDGLEVRALLAGNVTVQLLQGSAFLVGDALSNDIEIDQAGLSTNQLRVTGDDGTTINGRHGPLVVNVTKDLHIDLKDGGDSVALDGVVVSRDVSIAMGGGAGNSVFVESSTIGRDLTITTGDGTGSLGDGIDVSVNFNKIGRDLAIATGDGTTNSLFGIEVFVASDTIGRHQSITTGTSTP